MTSLTVTRGLWLAALLMGLAVVAAGCGDARTPTGVPAPTGTGTGQTQGKVRWTPRTDATPQELAKGEELYTANCQQCHGERGAGTQQGPTFLNDIYAPDHHSDQAFLLAPQQGVRPHHWDFGPMPPIAGLSEADRQEIVKYVRWLQGVS